MAVVTARGQITLPRAVREALGLVPGSQVDFSLESGAVVLRKRVEVEVVQRWQGYLGGKLPAESVDDFVEQLRGERTLPEASRE